MDKIYWGGYGRSAEWNKTRREGKAVRHSETDVLQAHGISAPEDFAYFTDCTNKAVYGCSAEMMKMTRGISDKGSLRDCSTQAELLLIALHENAVKDAIEKAKAYGREQIEAVYEKVDEALSRIRLSFASDRLQIEA
jgi:hypothetical protein